MLIIEDNLDAADSLREALEFSDHRVEVAHDGRRGLELALEFKPDVVLCDLGLPGIDGYEVARRIRANPTFQRTCLVALSGYTLPSDVQRAKDAGFDRHVPKPPELEELESLISEVIG